MGWRKRILLLLVGMLIAGNAFAASWVKYGAGNNGTVDLEYFLDAESIKASGHSRYVWLKQVDLKKVRKGLGKYKAHTLDYVLEKYLVDCDAETLQLLDDNWYFTDNVVDSEPIPYSAPRPVSPESVGEILKKLVCNVTE